MQPGVGRRTRVRHGRASGFGITASVTRWSSSWYEAMNARSVLAVAGNASNSSTASPSGSYARTKSGNRADSSATMAGSTGSSIRGRTSTAEALNRRCQTPAS